MPNNLRSRRGKGNPGRACGPIIARKTLQVAIEELIAVEDADVEQKLKSAPNMYWVAFQMGRQEMLQKIGICVSVPRPQL